jgi:leader peptidase (prepilin peptidase) / N-methyltransferase
MTALAGVLGAVTGSFLNVVVARMPQGQSLSRPRSHCPECQEPIKPWDNIPILSWLLLRGRCRSCATSISARYPLVELATALLFVVVALVNGFDEALLWELPLVAALVAVAAIDLEHRIIPNRIVVPLAVYGLAISAVLRPEVLPELAIAGAGAFVFLLVAALAYPAGMGMGDVKLAGAMGVYLGLSVVPAMFVAFITGTVVGLVIMAREGKDARKKGVPFGPFLALGGLVAVLAGPELIDLYENLFLG